MTETFLPLIVFPCLNDLLTGAIGYAHEKLLTEHGACELWGKLSLMST